ncbi:hypothetical protein Tco_1476049 [Tanacetum coccineum]
MTSPLLEQGSEDGDDTTPHATKEQIEGYLSTLRSLVKEHNSRGNVSPIQFVGPEFKMPSNVKLYDGTTDPDDHLSRFSSAANFREWPMPVWCRMFQQTLDRNARGWFERLPDDLIASLY